MDTVTEKPKVSVETIVDGNFAEGGNHNFSAYSESRNRYHVSKKAMASLGITTDEEFKAKAPLYAIVTTKTWNYLVTPKDVQAGVMSGNGIAYTAEDVNNQVVKTYKDDKGNICNATFDREEASAIFTDRQKAISAYTAKRKLVKEIAKQEQLEDIADNQEIELAKMQSKLVIQKFADDNELSPEKLKALYEYS